GQATTDNWPRHACALARRYTLSAAPRMCLGGRGTADALCYSLSALSYTLLASYRLLTHAAKQPPSCAASAATLFLHLYGKRGAKQLTELRG
ncbi:hypothetical protein BHM03_00008743, partial [Ensete ventricosum]